jgi:ketosteroid isomerase-like protein
LTPAAIFLGLAGGVCDFRHRALLLGDTEQAVSREDVEIVRRVYEAVGRGDKAAVLALYDPDVEVDGSRLPESKLGGPGTVVHGHDGLRTMTRGWADAWESFEDRCDELIDAGEHVISVVTRRGRGRASGAEASAPRAGVWTIRHGKVVRVVWFSSAEEALASAGLER